MREWNLADSFLIKRQHICLEDKLRPSGLKIFYRILKKSNSTTGLVVIFFRRSRNDFVQAAAEAFDAVVVAAGMLACLQRQRRQ